MPDSISTVVPHTGKDNRQEFCTLYFDAAGYLDVVHEVEFTGVFYIMFSNV